MLVIGIDDAGRGPLIGPMVLAGVLLTKDQEKILKTEGIIDSKQVIHSSRIKMSKIIKQNSLKHKIIQSSAVEIDESLNMGTNLNTLEAKKTAEIINSLNNLEERISVIIDCPSVNTLTWKNTLIKFVKKHTNLTIKCEHKADANHISVAAGSILAKVTREEEVAKIKEKYGDIGSGYPSDPKTKIFLRENGERLKDSGIFRKTWSTWKKLFPEDSQNNSQKTLGDF